MKIGIFDSGFGGLDVFGKISQELSEYDFIYFGDTARVPYGSRSQRTIYNYAIEAIDFLFKKGCRLVILPCNTVSAEALPKIQQQYLAERYPDCKVLGVIIPAVEEATFVTKNKRIGVIATESSVASGAFVREVKKIDPVIEVFQNACPLLVPLVESGEEDESIISPIIEKCLRPLVDERVDTMILGCTHYGILRKTIEDTLKKLNSTMQIVNEGEVVAQKLKEYLNRHTEIDNVLDKGSEHKFYTTDLSEKFKEIGAKVLGYEIDVEKVSLS